MVGEWSVALRMAGGSRNDDFLGVNVLEVTTANDVLVAGCGWGRAGRTAGAGCGRSVAADYVPSTVWAGAGAGRGAGWRGASNAGIGWRS